MVMRNLFVLWGEEAEERANLTLVNVSRNII